MPVVVYSDQRIEVSVGVDIRSTDEGLDTTGHEHRADLSNAIKITANSPNAHFIQFVTALVPDIYGYKHGEGLHWDSEADPYYMNNLNNPRWKVDVTEESSTCFYDEGGMKKCTATQTSMYDYPGGIFELIEERMIFCTFVIIDQQVSHKVKWSKQFDVNEREFYMVEVFPCSTLPEWAIKTVIEDYNNTNHGRTYTVYPGLEHLLNISENMTKEALEAQSLDDFLPIFPLSNWITMGKYPGLFVPQSVITENAIESLSV